MRRRLFSFLLAAALMSVAIAGCGSTNGETKTTTEVKDSETKGQPQGEVGKDTIKMGISVCLLTEVFVDQVDAFNKEAEGYGNIEITGQFDANMDSQKQLEHIQTFVSQGVDVIITSPVDTTIAAEMVELANGIPIVFTNRAPSKDVLSDGKYCYVGSLETDAGRMQGEYLAGILKDKGLTEVNYIMLIGDLGAENAIQRTASAKEALETAGFTLKATLEDTANWDRTEALNKVQQVIGSGKPVDCVIANCDEMALGAIEALKDADMLADVPVVSIDGVQNAILAVQSGEMTMTVLQNAQAQAKEAMKVAVELAEGKTVEQYYWVPYEAITPENVKSYLK